MPQPIHKPEAGTRTERVAINLFDLDEMDPTFRARLLVGKVSTVKAVTIDNDAQDEVAVEFTCDTKTAATIIDIIRSENRRLNETILRAYLDRGKGWTKIPKDAVLTDIINGGVVLNQEIFQPEALKVNARDAVKPKVQRLEFKRKQS